MMRRPKNLLMPAAEQPKAAKPMVKKTKKKPTPKPKPPVKKG